MLEPLMLLAATLAAGTLLPQDKSAAPPVEGFTCETRDGVRIVGDFYPPGRGRGQRGPVVILLHAIGPGRSSASRRDFGSFPRQLQAEGFAVVTFDFRGHGESQTIDPEKYWRDTPLPKAVKDRPPTKIDCRDFKTQRDFANLACDLVAIKVWINGKNNAKGCNSHAYSLVGVEQAGLVGLLWSNSELLDATRAADIASVRNNKADRYEGEDLVSVVWLGTPDRLGPTPVDPATLQGWLTRLRDRKVQTLAVVAEGEPASRQFWDRAQNSIRSTRDKDSFSETRVVRVKGTPLTGLKLLQHEAFAVNPEVLEFLDKTLGSTNRSWAEHQGNKEPTLVNLRGLGIN